MDDRRRETDPLADALEDWHSGEERREQRLSGLTRSRVLAEATAEQNQTSTALPALFFPWYRIAVAGAAPLLALTLAIGYLSLTGLGTDPNSGTLPVIGAEKRGDEVIFVIANGERAHRVYRSTNPLRFDAAPTATTRDGEFRDRLGTGPDLVFYRIE